MDFETVLKNLREKFTSGNEIPVQRSTIDREEYIALTIGIAELLEFKRDTLLEKLRTLEKDL